MTRSERGSATARVWKSASDALLRGDAPRLERLLREHRKLFRSEQPPPYAPGGPAPDYSGYRAKTIIARAHHFRTWAQFVEARKAVARKSSPVARFEAAVDAVVDGDVARLTRLLRASPDLARARSRRKHHATLLHYVGANGVEDFRQKTPKNAPRVAEVLLKAGAEVDAVAGIYGGATPLELAATSIHPAAAGVLEDLIQVFVKHGAAVDGVDGRSIVTACLANGRREAAELLARHGAQLDLEGAAGLGRLDVVRRLSSGQDGVKSRATKRQMTYGFMWACEYGRTRVVDFLLDRGVPVAARANPNGQTGLHWAAFNAHVDVVRLLLRRRAPLNVKDRRYGGTPLGWALHGLGRPGNTVPRRRYHDVVSRLVAAGAKVEPGWLEDGTIRRDRRMLAALSGEKRSREDPISGA